MTPSEEANLDIPFVERSWRTFRSASHNQVRVMEHLEAQAPSWARETNLHMGEVVLPSSFVEQSVVEIIGDAPDVEKIAIAASSTMTSFSAYRRTKIIYRLNENLAWDLLNAKWPGEYPIEQFRLPHNGMVIEVPPTIMRHLADLNGALNDLPPEQFFDGLNTYISWNHFICYYDLGWDAGQDGSFSPGLVLRVGRPLPSSDQVYAAGKFSLSGFSTIDEAWADFVIAADHLWDSMGQVPPSQHSGTTGVDDRQHVFRLLLNAILYIQGNDDVVALIHPGSRPPKSSKSPVKARRFQDLADPHLLEVGNRYGAMIERWEIADQNKFGPEGEASGRTVRPHLRAAHAHLYWIGPGKKVARVRFLPPIKVKGGYQEIEASTVVIRNVK